MAHWVRVTGPARVSQLEENRQASRDVLESLDGRVSNFDGDWISDYFDCASALGVSEGGMQLLLEGGALRVSTELKAARELSENEVLRLVDEVLAQWADGYGNDAFGGVLEDHAISAWEHGDCYELRASWLSEPRIVDWLLVEKEGRRFREPRFR